MTVSPNLRPLHRAALLRAVNVGGRGAVKMESLCRAFRGLGFTDVRAYRQSGNVLFAGPAGEEESELSGRIEVRLRDDLGLETTVLLRSERELARLVRRDPFADEAAGRDVKRYVTFLARRPRPGLLEPSRPPAKDGLEILSLEGREVFLLARRVAGRHGFPNDLVERRLGQPATTRSWNTVVALAASLEGAARLSPR